MIQEKYLKELQERIEKFSNGRNLKFFIYGSSLIRDHFGDIDIGVEGEVEKHDLYKLKEQFEESTFPYCVDIVHFDRVSKDFKENVFKNKILWITR